MWIEMHSLIFADELSWGKRVWDWRFDCKESKGVYQDALRCNRDAFQKTRVSIFIDRNGMSGKPGMDVWLD